MAFCNISFYDLLKGSSQASFVALQRLWGPIQSPVDSVGVYLSVLGGWNKPCGADSLTLEEANLWLCHGCTHQEYSSGEQRAGSGPWAATGRERVLEMQTRLVVRAALPAPAAAAPSAAASAIVPAEGDAGSYRKKKKKGNCFASPLPSSCPMEMQNAFCELQTSAKS